MMELEVKIGAAISNEMSVLNPLGGDGIKLMKMAAKEYVSTESLMAFLSEITKTQGLKPSNMLIKDIHLALEKQR